MSKEMAQQMLFMDSSSALALVRRARTGRLKHIQIKQSFLQHVLRKLVFTTYRINAKLNPGDLTTKRLGGESCVSRLIGLFRANADEENDDSTVRQIRKANRATRAQCVRPIQMA